MFARIYRPAKNAMQSGRGKSKAWRLEFAPEMAKRPDPLMGWTSSGDVRGQVKLSFETKEQAVAYAQRHGIPFQVAEPQEAKCYAKTYGDNFSADRKEPWSH
jgi:hypothetical protein